MNVDCNTLPFGAICLDRHLNIIEVNEHFRRHLIKSHEDQFALGGNLLLSATSEIVIQRISDALRIGCDQSVYWIDNEYNFPLKTANLVQCNKMITNVNIALTGELVWLFIFDVTNEAKAVRDQRNIEDKLRIESQTDALTGLYNRKYMYQQISYFRDLALRDNTDPEYSLVLIDLDHFKQINDNHGHIVGDEVLVSVSNALIRTMRKTDITARLGGEEFLVFLPATKNNESTDLTRCCERIHKAVRGLRFNADGIEFGITCSVGAVKRRISHDFESAYRAADTLMYKAKNKGRNQTAYES